MSEAPYYGETPPDPRIRDTVDRLREAGIETFESCQGGLGHCSPEPFVRFHGGAGEGFRAYAVARTLGLPVFQVLREWTEINGELTGPYWKMIFRPVWTGQPIAY